MWSVGRFGRLRLGDRSLRGECRAAAGDWLDWAGVDGRWRTAVWLPAALSEWCRSLAVARAPQLIARDDMPFRVMRLESTVIAYRQEEPGRNVQVQAASAGIRAGLFV